MIDKSVPILLATRQVRLGQMLGAGASAEVWTVHPVDTTASEKQGALGPWALKIGSADKSRYLASEAERLTFALSERLPRALEVGRFAPSGLPNPAWNSAPYVLMTLVPGTTLQDTLERANVLGTSGNPSAERRWRVNLARCVARDVGCALADLHAAGVGHGDLKPENILVEERRAEDGTSNTVCGVVDLGLSTERGNETVTGGTWRYLPPEVHNAELGAGDAQSRDLWALGLILKEIVGEPRDSELNIVIQSLLATTPTARPRAAWVAEQAGYRSNLDARVLMIRRRYLQAQRPFLRQTKERGEATIAVEGHAKDWLQSACQVLTGLRQLQNPSLDTKSLGKLVFNAEPTPVAVDLSSEARVHFFMQLCGNAALDFPPLPATHSDGELMSRLVQAAHTCPPEAFTYETLVASLTSQAPEAEPVATDVVSLSLQLGADNPPLSVLAHCEALARTESLPVPLLLRLSNAFKRRGELGRARALLLNRTEESARVALASVLARAGARAESLELAQPICQTKSSPLRGEAAALCARVFFAAGELEQAQRVLDDCVEGDVIESPAVLEARASIALAYQQPNAAQRHLDSALGRKLDPEQRARLEALVAHLAHQRGDHQAALRSYERAVTSAARAGALVEEATYLVGVASTALPLGRITDTLQAAQRALYLFEFLHNPSAAARAALNRACGLWVAGASTEARSAVVDTIQRARRAKDSRCEALAHLLASHTESPHVAREHLERAEQLLTPLQPSDRLRINARRLMLSPQGLDVHANDASATDAVEPESRLLWWTARAQQALDASVADPSSSQTILAALSTLVDHSEPVDTVAKAFAAGAELAARRGEGDRSLQFVVHARRAHQRLQEGAPPDLQRTVKELPWASWLVQHSPDSPLKAEQVGEIERLVRDLSDRSRLRAVLDRVLDALVRWTGVERGLLLLPAPDGKLVVRAARNLAAQDLSQEQRQLSQTLARQALETGDCVVAMDASGELSSLHQSVHALRLRSVLAVPLTARGETQGVVYLDDRVRRGAFGPPELAWVRLVGTIAAVAIAEARDQARLRRSTRRAQRAERQLASHLASKESELVNTKLALDSVTLPGITHGMVGRTQSMQRLFSLVTRVAPADITVFISGESGTGKELVARALHSQSLRATKPFVTENCSAIPANLLESILFGHKKGAFTGASHNHTGLFELAHGGTLFLDELGEMSLAMQAKLLRVLETGELRRVGGERSIHVNVRVVGASHRNLEHMVHQGTFREDLYYRLNVITIALPSLRERAADIPELVSHFMRKYGRNGAPNMSPQALAALQSYPWPGNVRQLENEIRRAMVLTDDSIGLEHLSASIVGAPLPHAGSETSLNLRDQLNALEARLIERALKDAHGNQSRAAETLGVSRFGLQKMLKRLGLSAPK